MAEMILNDYHLSLVATSTANHYWLCPVVWTPIVKRAARSQPGSSLQGILREKRHFVQWKEKYWVNNY